MEVRLDGRSAIITGASKGLGLAMAKEFAASGADVAMLARDPEGLEEAKQTGRRGGERGKVATFHCDVAKADDIQKTFDAVNKTFGKVDILINNAGHVTRHDIRQDHRRDLAGRSGPETFRCDPLDPSGVAGDAGAQVGPHHQRPKSRCESPAGGGAPDRGVTGSGDGADEGAVQRGRAAWHPGQRHAGGADRLRSARPASPREGSNVPYDEFRSKMGANVPIGRIGKAEEFAAMACFLCSDLAGFTTGPRSTWMAAPRPWSDGDALIVGCRPKQRSRRCVTSEYAGGSAASGLRRRWPLQGLRNSSLTFAGRRYTIVFHIMLIAAALGCNSAADAQSDRLGTQGPPDQTEIMGGLEPQYVSPECRVSVTLWRSRCGIFVFRP